MGFEIVFWYWWIAAVFLLGVEMLSPGFFFLWMAVSALITGFLLLIIPFMSVEVQLFIFAVLSMASVMVWKRYMEKQTDETDHPNLNERGSQYIGRTFTLIKAIEHGQGKIKVGDSQWKVEGEDCPLGSTVRVVDVDGTVFKVEKVN